MATCTYPGHVAPRSAVKRGRHVYTPVLHVHILPVHVNKLRSLEWLKVTRRLVPFLCSCPQLAAVPAPIRPIICLQSRSSPHLAVSICPVTAEKSILSTSDDVHPRVLFGEFLPLEAVSIRSPPYSRQVNLRVENNAPDCECDTQRPP